MMCTKSHFSTHHSTNFFLFQNKTGRGRGRGQGRGGRGGRGRGGDIGDYNGPILQLQNPMRLQRIPVAMPEREGRGGEGREYDLINVCFIYIRLIVCSLALVCVR